MRQWGLLLGVMLIGLTLGAGPGTVRFAAARAQVPDLEAAQALLAEGKAEEVYQFLAPFEAQLAGDLKYDHLLARSALDSGRPSIASFIYERILAVEPNYAGVRLENGRAYLELNDYARAKQEFETVLRFENLPPDLRSTAEQYARIVEERLTPKKNFLNAYADYGFGYDGNINSAIAEAIVSLPGGLLLLLDPLSQQREDFYHSLNAGAEAIHAIDQNWQLFLGADYRGRLHIDETIFDYHDLEGRVGVGYATGTHNIRLSGRFGRFFIDDRSLRDVGGATVDWLHALDDRNQLNLTGGYSQYRFNGPLIESNNFDGYAGALGWNHAFAQGRGLLGLSVNAGYEKDQGGRLDGNKRVGGLNLSLQGAFSDQIGAFAFIGVQRGNYQSRNALFLVRRHDTLFSASGGVTWTFAPGWALRPQVSWSKNRSNVPLSDYDRLDFSLNLRKDF